ncbi:MAG: Stp1/IreP family PP2C-type Ser/Thr phosphatase [Myxococcota bacterium]
MNIIAVGQSDVGRVREHNEDAHLVSNDLGLYVVADGMGGHLGGQTASSLAVQTVEETVAQFAPQIEDGAGVMPLESSPVPRLLADAVRAACGAIFDVAQNDPDLLGMGTTVTALVVKSGRAFIAHVGDSRCYLQRKGRIIQITDDHSLVNEQIKAGLITREQARQSRLKNIITRSVGFEKDVAVDTFALPVQAGDRLLMCSDGLANFVDDTEIGLALATLRLEEVPAAMIDLANERGGDDNITVVCVATAE